MKKGVWMKIGATCFHCIPMINLELTDTSRDLCLPRVGFSFHSTRFLLISVWVCGVFRAGQLNEHAAVYM